MAIQLSSHLIQVVTDLSNQVAQLNRKVDLLLERSGEKWTDDTEANVTKLLASLPVKDEESFEHFNNQIKVSQTQQAIVCRMHILKYACQILLLLECKLKTFLDVLFG